MTDAPTAAMTNEKKTTAPENYINRVTLGARLKQYTRSPLSLILMILVMLAAIFSVGMLIFIIAYILINGVPHLTAEQFDWNYTTENVSMMPAMINTLIMTALTLVIAVPIGVFAAVYLVEYAKRGNKLVKVIRVTTETLSGIPSIIYGLVGMLIFCKNGTSLLAGALTLTIMNLPSVMRTAQESLKTVPQSYREGAFALGAGRWRTIRTVVLPSCVDGVITGCILSAGRILGESAALLFTAGSAHMLYNFFEGMRNAGATLTVALYFYAKESSDTGVVFAIAAILMLLTMLINLAATLTARYFRRKQE